MLACAHCTRPGHCPNHHTSNLGANSEAQRRGPTRSRTARISAPRLAHPAGVVELVNISVHLLHAAKEYVEHLFRESLREHHLEALEKRRPGLFGGIGARIDRELTLSELARCATELDRSMLRGLMAGALWTADTAHQRGLRQADKCPYCRKGSREDEDHLLWWCMAWKSARELFLPELMLMARSLKLGVLSDWPPCLRLCGLLSEEVVRRSGLARGPG